MVTAGANSGAGGSASRWFVEAPALREVTSVRVIYGDTDQMGFVYYANYLRYFEVAANALLREAGFSYRAFETDYRLLFPVIEVKVNYRCPAGFDDELVLYAGVRVGGRASMRFDYRIVRVGDGLEVALGHTLHACVDRAGKAKPIPQTIRTTLIGTGASASSSEQARKPPPQPPPADK
jgi:acyl-CoA thioester hydrolase